MKKFEIKELKKALNNLEILISDIEAVRYSSNNSDLEEVLSNLEQQKFNISEIIYCSE